MLSIDDVIAAGIQHVPPLRIAQRLAAGRPKRKLPDLRHVHAVKPCIFRRTVEIIWYSKHAVCRCSLFYLYQNAVLIGVSGVEEEKEDTALALPCLLLPMLTCALR